MAKYPNHFPINNGFGAGKFDGINNTGPKDKFDNSAEPLDVPMNPIEALQGSTQADLKNFGFKNDDMNKIPDVDPSKNLLKFKELNEGNEKNNALRQALMEFLEVLYDVSFGRNKDQDLTETNNYIQEHLPNLKKALEIFMTIPQEFINKHGAMRIASVPHGMTAAEVIDYVSRNLEYDENKIKREPRDNYYMWEHVGSVLEVVIKWLEGDDKKNSSNKGPQMPESKLALTYDPKEAMKKQVEATYVPPTIIYTEKTL